MIRWFGDELLGKIAKATAEGIDETTEAIANDAGGTSMNLLPHTAAGHRWHGVTPRVEEEIASEPAKIKGTGITGRVGFTQKRGAYGFMLERLNPTVRPAFDREAPKLAERIRKKL